MPTTLRGEFSLCNSAVGVFLFLKYSALKDQIPNRDFDVASKIFQ
jgi:hypothetical protein